MRLQAHGIAVDLPAGWEGAITAPAAAPTVAAGPGDGPSKAAGPRLPVAHLATIALPAERGDFGSGAVEDLGPDDAFVALLEYGPECAGTPAFSRRPRPRRIHPGQLSRRALQRTLDGQAGCQVFFTEGDRAFCLYVVVGRDHHLGGLLARVNAALSSILIEPHVEPTRR